MTGLTDMSNTSAVSGVTGITALPEYMKYGRIRLPKMNDLTFKGLSKVQAYGQGIILQIITNIIVMSWCLQIF